MAKRKSLLHISKNILILGWVSFLCDTASEMIYPVLPIFLTTVLGLPKAFVGLIEGIAESASSLLRVFSGWLSDRLGKRKSLVVLGYFLAALAKPLLAIASRVWQFVLIRFMDRGGKGIRTAPRDALIADASSNQHFGRSFGYHRMMDTLGAVFGPLLAFIGLRYLPGQYRLIFLLATIPAFLSVALLILGVKEKRFSKEAHRAIKDKKYLTLKFKIFIAIMVIFALGNSSDTFLILRAENIGVSILFIPLLYMFFNGVYALFSLPAGILSDKIGRRRVIIIGWLIYSLIYLGLARVQAPWQIWIIFAFYGVYYALYEGVSRAFVADVVEVDHLGLAYGVYHTAVGLALFPASLLAGILWDRIGPEAPFYFGSLLALLATILLIIFIRSPRFKHKTSLN